MRTFIDRIITNEGLRKRIEGAKFARREEIEDGRGSNNDWNDPDSVHLICEELLALRAIVGTEADYETHERWIKRIITDEGFATLVRAHANGERGHVKTISAHLRKDTATYKRLAETPEGKYWREVDTKCPDHTLRSIYRKALVKP